MKPYVTIIVPTYNREAWLRETLASLAQLSYPHERHEVIVVDQTRTHEPETEQALRAAWIRWERPDFASLTQARNYGLGIMKKETEIVIFVDDDVTVMTDFIDAHVAAYKNPKVGAVAGRVTVPGHVYPAAEPDQVAGITWFGRFINNFYGTTEQDCEGFVGCNFSLRASILPQTGLFDQNFIGNAMREETDMAMRVRAVGFQIRYRPQADLIHHMDAAGGTRTAGKMVWYAAFFHNHFLFYGKHFPRWRVPFFVVALWRPILACSIVYGHGTPTAIMTPWRGIVAGLHAAKKSKYDGLATNSAV